MNKILPRTVFTIFLCSVCVLKARNDVDHELLSQSRSQQSVGRSVQSTVNDLENLIADLESNGLIDESMVEKMRVAREVLNSISEDNIPEATARLRAAALRTVGRRENLTQASGEIDRILGELKKTARDVGDEQKRSAYGQILSQLLTNNKDLQDQTRKWGEELLVDPGQAEDTRDQVMEKQSEVESQFDALKQMLDKEIANQEASPLQQELQDILDALEGQGMEPTEPNIPQGVPETSLSSNPIPPTTFPPASSNLPQPPTPPQSPTGNDEEKGTEFPAEPKDNKENQVSPENKDDAGNQDKTKPKSTSKDPSKDKPEGNKESTQDKTDPAKMPNQKDKPAQQAEKPGKTSTESKPKEPKSKPDKKEGPESKSKEKQENKPTKPSEKSPERDPAVAKDKPDNDRTPSQKEKDPKVLGTKPEDHTKPKDPAPKERKPKVTDPEQQEAGKPKEPKSLATKADQENKESAPKKVDPSPKDKGKEESAEKALEKSGNSIIANDAGSALEAQKKFQERLAKALSAMGAAMANNLKAEGSSESSPSMAPPPMSSPPFPAQGLDHLAGMAFGSESKGQEIGDLDLDALLSGEDPESSTGTGKDEGQPDNGKQPLQTATGFPPGAPPPPPSLPGGSPKGAGKKEKGKPGTNPQNMPAPGKGGSSQMASMQSSNPFAPPMMMPGGGAPGEGSGTATAMFDKPHGTHFETTAIKGGGGPAKGSYEKTQQSKRNLAEVARQKIQQDYQRRLPAEYRDMTAEYFELLGAMEE